MIVCLLLLLILCVLLLFRERRKSARILGRFEKILTSGTSDYLADESLTPTERRLITRLRELETREAQVQRGYANLSSLVADIAHQSKTPLSSILLYAELNSGTDTLRIQTEKLKFLIESLTKLAKCEGGLIAENLSPKQNSVRDLIRTVVETHFSAADGKNIDLRCDVPEELTAVFDLRWTGEAVGNILDNAVKYSPAGSTVRISACAYDLFVRIDVADEGSGIPEEDLCNLWKRFYRGKNAENHAGVGIGLYLTESILNTEGGRCSVKSSGEGSTFSVFLPK